MSPIEDLNIWLNSGMLSLSQMIDALFDIRVTIRLATAFFFGTAFFTWRKRSFMYNMWKTYGNHNNRLVELHSKTLGRITIFTNSPRPLLRQNGVNQRSLAMNSPLIHQGSEVDECDSNSDSVCLLHFYFLKLRQIFLELYWNEAASSSRMCIMSCIYILRTM